MDANIKSKRSQLEADLKRLKVKYSESNDADIRSALKLRIDDLSAQLDAQADATEEVVEDVITLPAPPTPEQIQEIEVILRQANVAKVRGQSAEYNQLVARAHELGAGYPPVIAMYADVLIAKQASKEALNVLKMGKLIAPDDREIEKRYADLIFRTKVATDMSLTSFDGDEIDKRKAKILNFFIPGCGQIMNGDTELGWGLLGTWAFFAAMTVLGFSRAHPVNFGPVPSTSTPGQPFFTGVGVMGTAVCIAIQVYSIIQIGPSDPKQKLDPSAPKPVPPVNLPYE